MLPALLLATTALGQAAPGGAVLLLFQPPLGKTVSYVQTTSFRQTSPGFAKPIVSTTTMPITLRVVSRANGVTTVESKIGKVTVDMAPDSPLAALKADMEKTESGITVLMSVDEHGRPKLSKLDVQGPNADLVRRVGAGVSQLLQGIAYPDHPLKPGESWADTLDLGKMLDASLAGLPGKPVATGKATVACRLLGVEDGLARLAFTMQGSARIESGGTALTEELMMAGETTMEVATGLTRATTSTSDTTMTAAGGTTRQHMVTTMKRVS